MSEIEFELRIHLAGLIFKGTSVVFLVRFLAKPPAHAYRNAMKKLTREFRNLAQSAVHKVIRACHRASSDRRCQNSQGKGFGVSVAGISVRVSEAG